MSTIGLEEITSVCTTPKELIKSADFMRGVKIITQDKRIIGLFTKLQNDEVLDNKEKEELFRFMTDDKVAEEIQELLSYLEGVSVNVKTNNSKELAKLSAILNSIFAEDGYKKVIECVGKVADIAKITLMAYEGMDEIVLNSLGGRKIYVKLFVEVDDIALIYELSNGYKSNFPESRTIDNPELITRNTKGYYHFGHTASDNRLKELGMRPLTDEEMDSPELIKYITENVQRFPGLRVGSDIHFEGDNVYFWGDSSSSNENVGSSIEFNSCNAYNSYKTKVSRSRFNKAYGLCLLGVKD